MKIPLSIKVSLWTLKNRWFKSPQPQKRFITDLLIVGLLYLLLKAIFGGVTQTLLELEKRELLDIHPSFLIYFIMLCFMGLVTFSAGVITISAFFLSEDIPLLISAPLTRISLFLRKFAQVYVGACWLILLMAMPILIAFQIHYDAGWQFYTLVLPALLLTSSLPVSIMICLCIAVASICPANRMKEAFVLLGLAIVSSAYYLLNAESTRSVETVQNIENLRSYLEASSSSREYVYPIKWLSDIAGNALVSVESFSYWPLFYLTAFALLSFYLAYTVFSLLYSNALYKSQQQSRTTHYRGLISRKNFSPLRSLLPSHYRAIFTKEMKLFSRDLTQALQLVLILGLCFVYLYNFRNLHKAQIFSENVEGWWQGFLILSNIFLGALITIAVTARFVYPTLSLEGKSFWMLKSSPVPLREILTVKFWFWFIPVSAISTVVFTSGALAIQANPFVVQLHVLCSWVLCYGIVGMAIGLGAYFADFEWQHSAEITASMGNFLFMLASTCLVLVLMFPIALLIVLYIFRSLHMPIPTGSWYVAVVCCVILICYLTYSSRKLALYLGTKALRKKM